MQHKNIWFVGFVHFIRTAIPVFIVSLIGSFLIKPNEMWLLPFIIIVIVTFVISFRKSIAYIVKKYNITDPRGIGLVFATYYVGLHLVNAFLIHGQSLTASTLVGIVLGFVILYESTRTLLNKRLGIKI